MELTEFVSLMLGLSVVIERGIQFLFKPYVNLFVAKENKIVRTPIFNTLAALVGNGVAFSFSMTIMKRLGIEGNVYVDMIITGILLGGGANLIHPLLKRFAPEEDLETNYDRFNP